MLKKLTKLIAVASLAISSCIPAVGTVFAQETNATQEHVVSLTNEGTTYTFGNDFLTRTFNTAGNVLKTEKVTNYRTDGNATILVPDKNEEFVINTLPNSKEVGSITFPTKKLATTGWDATSDSVATNEGSNGPASKLFDGNNNTYYHSKYSDASDAELKYPHNIYVDMKAEKTISSLCFQERVYNNAQTDSGRVKGFNLYIGSSLDEVKASTTPILTGEFDNALETYVNLEETVKTQFIRIEFTSCYPPRGNASENVACGSELVFYEDKVIYPPKSTTTIKSSEMELNGEPVLTDIENGKQVTFNFKPVVARGVEYTISEVLTMKHGESFMRKHLEITVPEADAANAMIDYIDLENMNFAAKDVQGKLGDKTGNYWTIPELKNNPDMANMNGNYLELGQPYYVGAMYWGCEFPQTENKIRNNNGFIRYHYGKSLAIDTQFTNYNNYNNANGVSGKMVTWDAVAGAARSTDYSVVQADFYEYIETIATPTEFRQQFNSWYDNMKNITDANIKSSFSEVEKGFTQHGVNPLDSYVVDDGWINYNSFWDFDRSASKFPNELYDSSRLVNQMGSNFGLWLGPRGGYGTEGTIASWIENHGLGSRNWQSGGDINISDARYLNKLVNDIFLDYQEKFDINYWKLDGMLLNPSTAAGNYHVVGNPFYTISETYERWTDMYETMRAQRGDKGLWINMTSYTNPSPWHLQWVNSVWMQNTGDSGFNYKFGASDEEAMLTYRDGDYYDFFNENQWQLPNKYFYNHDPVYAKTAHSAPGGTHLISYTDEELRNHLYMLGTRGTAFWEYYYSPSMFDDDKWDVNAEAANWIKDNFHILQKSIMFGSDPEYGNVYGYSCWDGTDGIVSLRNPSDVVKEYTITYDRLIGVAENTSNVYGKVIIGDIARQTNKPLNYGDSITYTLQPKEVLIVQYGAQDTTPATIQSIHTNGNKVEVEFNETIRAPKAENFTVEGNTVNSIVFKEDLRTVELTLANAEKDTAIVNVKVNGVQDIVGNETTASYSDDYYENDVVNSIVDRTVDGTEINKGNVYAIDGKEGFSVTGVLTTTSKNAEIVRQEGNYTVGIDADGYLTFTVHGLTVNSKYVAKTRQDDGSVTAETKGKIADGVKHQFTAVKEVNGMLKLYIDGELVGSAYDEANINPEITKANLVFAKDLTGTVDYVTVLDTALAFDEVAKLVDVKGNVMSRQFNSNVRVHAYDVTENKPVVEKDDRPFSHLNDGNKDYRNNYLELMDTRNGKKHVRYVEIDLGANFELNKFFLQRFSDGRTYGPTAIVVSKDANFTNKNVVFNTDKAGTVLGLGNGTDDLYAETTAGKTVTLDTPVTGRYIRIYVNGNTNNSTSDHLVEFEAYGSKKASAIYRIDYTELEELVNADLSKYTPDSVKAYEAAAKETLDAANALLATKDATSDAEVTTLVDQLKEHRKVLVMEGITPVSISATLTDKISLNLYLKVSEQVLADETAYVEFSVLDDGKEVTKRIPVAEFKKSGSLYVVSMPLYARQMSDTVTMNVHTVNEDKTFTYSVKEYGNKVLTSTKATKVEKEAVEAMLNYGATAQTYFKHNLNDLANSEVTNKLYETVTAEELATYAGTIVNGDVKGATYGATNLRLLSGTAIRHHFIVDKNEKDNLKFYVVKGTEQKELTPKFYDENKAYVEISNVYAESLDKPYVVKVVNTTDLSKETTVTYSAFSYAKAILEKEDASKEMKDVVKAMVEYNRKANAYKNFIKGQEGTDLV